MSEHEMMVLDEPGCCASPAKPQLDYYFADDGEAYAHFNGEPNETQNTPTDQSDDSSD